jgi:hypothetical protein
MLFSFSEEAQPCIQELFSKYDIFGHFLNQIPDQSAILGLAQYATISAERRDAVIDTGVLTPLTTTLNQDFRQLGQALRRLGFFAGVLCRYEIEREEHFFAVAGFVIALFGTHRHVDLQTELLYVQAYTEFLYCCPAAAGVIIEFQIVNFLCLDDDRRSPSWWVKTCRFLRCASEIEDIVQTMVSEDVWRELFQALSCATPPCWVDALVTMSNLVAVNCEVFVLNGYHDAIATGVPGLPFAGRVAAARLAFAAIMSGNVSTFLALLGHDAFCEFLFDAFVIECEELVEPRNAALLTLLIEVMKSQDTLDRFMVFVNPDLVELIGALAESEGMGPENRELLTQVRANLPDE